MPHLQKRRKWLSRMRTSAVSEENGFARSKSTLLASMSVLRLPGSASRGLVLSHFDQFLTFGCAHVQKRRKCFFPNAHSSERRLRGELVCSLENHVARVDVGIALHSGCASREPVLSHFDQFLTFGCAARAKTSEMVFPDAHKRRFRGELVCSLEKHVARVDVGIASPR